jgi:hypothetical protein
MSKNKLKRADTQCLAILQQTQQTLIVVVPPITATSVPKMTISFSA